MCRCFQVHMRSILLTILSLGSLACREGISLNPYSKISQVVADKNVATSSGALARCVVTENDLCYEGTNLSTNDIDTANSYCGFKNGIFSENVACSRTNTVGGCTQTGGGTSQSSAHLVTWYYAPTYTVQDIQSQCAAAKETYIAH